MLLRSRIFCEVDRPTPKMVVSPTSTRLLSGMLTPAIRAMLPFLALSLLFNSLLTLPLLVPRVLADHQDHAATADHLALLAHRLHRCSYFHCSSLCLSGEIARRPQESDRRGSGP